MLGRWAFVPFFVAVVSASLPIGARAQDVAAGQRVFNQCRACHVIGAGMKSTLGPNMFGAFGRTAGTLEGFRYSANMKEKGAAGLVWSEETLRAYITNPKQVVPAGSMAFPGLRNEQQVNDLIAYLVTAK